MDRETDLPEPRGLLFPAKYIAMFIRCLPAVDLGLTFDCIAWITKTIFCFPSRTKCRAMGVAGGQGGLNLFCISPSQPFSEELI